MYKVKHHHHHQKHHHHLKTSSLYRKTKSPIFTSATYSAADDQAYNLGVAADNDNDKIPPSSSKHHQPKTSSSSYGKTKTAKMPPPPKWKNVTPAWEKTARLIISRLNRLKVDVVRVAKRIKAGDLIDNVHLNKKGYTTLQMINFQSILN